MTTIRENEEVGGGDSDVSGGPDGWSDVNEENVSEEVVREMGDSNCNVKRGFRGRAFKLGDDGKIHIAVRQLYMNIRHFRQIIFYYSVQEGFILKRIKNKRKRITCSCRMRTFGQMLSLVLFCIQLSERWMADLNSKKKGTSTVPLITGLPQKIKRLKAGIGSISAAIGVPINSQHMPTITHVLWYPSTQNQSSSEAAYGSSSHTNQSNDAFASQPLHQMRRTLFSHL
ncbi:hypothetical protein ACOSQ2_005497 [Xanthoceras sorbifolium]